MNRPVARPRRRLRHLRRLDRAGVTPARRAGDAAGCLGSGARAFELGRRHADHPRDLRKPCDLHADGAARAGTMAGGRVAVAGGAAAADRGGLAGGRGFALRRCIGGDARRGRPPVRRGVVARCRTPLSADGLRGCGARVVEPQAGYLFARRACAHVAARFMAEGGTCRVAAAASPVSMDADGVLLTDGGVVSADNFVFACGPWLGDLFPDIVGDNRQADAAGGLLLRHAGRRCARSSTVAAGVARVWASGSSTASPPAMGAGSRLLTIRRGRRWIRPVTNACRPSEGIAAARDVSRNAVPGAAGCSAARRGGVPVRDHARLALHHRSASRRRACLDRRRGVRPRFQDGAGRRR